MPWKPDEKAEGGYKFIDHVVCRKCGKVIDDEGSILDASGHYQCPNCGYKNKRAKTRKDKQVHPIGSIRRTPTCDKCSKKLTYKPQSEKGNYYCYTCKRWYYIDDPSYSGDIDYCDDE